MHYRHITYIILFALYSTITYSQEKKVVYLKELSIGDTMPNIPLKSMLNYTGGPGGISSFKGKWLILDFWATYCAACITSMPHLQQLQNKFKENLNIVLVTQEDRNKVTAFLQKSAIARKTHLPFILNDTLLHHVFPHRVIPHEIWIDPTGMVRAVTSHLEVTEDNIYSLLSGKTPKWNMKKDNMNFNTVELNEDILNRSNSKSEFNKTLFRSALTSYGGINSGGTTWKTDSSTDKLSYKQLKMSFYMFGDPPTQLFFKAYKHLIRGGFGNMNIYEIDSDIKDSSVYNRYFRVIKEQGEFSPQPTNFPYLTWNSYDEYSNEMRVNYEFSANKGISDSLLAEYIFQDLNRYFPIKARIEKRKTLSWVIVAKSNANNLLLADGLTPPQSRLNSSDSLKYKNAPFIRLINHLSSFVNHPPIVDETGIDPYMLINMTLDFSDSPLLNRKMGIVVNSPLHYETAKRELNKYGLDLIKEERIVPILVFY